LLLSLLDFFIFFRYCLDQQEVALTASVSYHILQTSHALDWSLGVTLALLFSMLTVSLDGLALGKNKVVEDFSRHGFHT
jgi:hypothetical protein